MRQEIYYGCHESRCFQWHLHECLCWALWIPMWITIISLQASEQLPEMDHGADGLVINTRTHCESCVLARLSTWNFWSLLNGFYMSEMCWRVVSLPLCMCRAWLISYLSKKSQMQSAEDFQYPLKLSLGTCCAPCCSSSRSITNGSTIKENRARKKLEVLVSHCCLQSILAFIIPPLTLERVETTQGETRLCHVNCKS